MIKDFLFTIIKAPYNLYLSVQKYRQVKNNLSHQDNTIPNTVNPVEDHDPDKREHVIKQASINLSLSAIKEKYIQRLRKSKEDLHESSAKSEKDFYLRLAKSQKDARDFSAISDKRATEIEVLTAQIKTLEDTARDTVEKHEKTIQHIQHTAVLQEQKLAENVIDKGLKHKIQVLIIYHYILDIFEINEQCNIHMLKINPLINS